MVARIATFLLVLLLLPAFAEAQPKLPAAKTATLSGTMKVSEALASLAKQTGIAIEDRRGEPDADIHLEFSKLTFWQALDRIAYAAGDAQVDLYAPGGKLALTKRTGKPPAKDVQIVSYDGLFRTSIKRVTAAIDPESGQTTYAAALEVAWEPTLQPFYLETRPQKLVVKDEQLRELPAIDLGKASAPVEGRNALVFETPFPALPRDAKKIGLIEGGLSVIAPNRMLTFSFDTLDKLNTMVNAAPPQQPQKAEAGVVCRISKIKLERDHWTVRVDLSYPPGNTELDSNQSWVVNNELVLEAKDGAKRFPHTSYLLENATATGASLIYNFEDDPKTKRLRGKPEEWKLSYRTPAAVVTIPFSFSFTNVPLP